MVSTEIVIAGAVNIGALGAGIKYLSYKVSRLEKKQDRLDDAIHNGLSEKLARIEETVRMLWELRDKK